MKQTADRIYIKDTKGRFVFVSDALAHMHGPQQRDELIGMSDFNFLPRTPRGPFTMRNSTSSKAISR